MSHKATLITLPSPAVCSARTAVCSPRTPYSTTTTRFTTSSVRKQPEQTPIWRQLLTALVFLIIFALYLAVHAAWGAAAMCLGWKMLQQSLPSIEMSPRDLAVSGAAGGSLAFLVQTFTFQFALFDWLYTKSQDEDATKAYKIVLVLYTKTCALLNGLVVGLIAGLLSGQELGWMVLAGFLGMEVFVLVESVMQGLVLWRKKSLQGVWVLECCNLVPHHLACAMDAWDYYMR